MFLSPPPLFSRTLFTFLSYFFLPFPPIPPCLHCSTFFPLPLFPFPFFPFSFFPFFPLLLSWRPPNAGGRVRHTPFVRACNSEYKSTNFYKFRGQRKSIPSFELVAHNAVKKTFPGIILSARKFHLHQGWRKRIHLSKTLRCA